MFVMCSAPQKRFIANGRSRLTVMALTLSPRPDSCSLNFLVCVWQTGVSSEGTTLINVGLPFRSAGVTVTSAPFSKLCSLKSGAFCPTATALPARVMGLPLNVTAPERDMVVSFRVIASTAWRTGSIARCRARYKGPELEKRGAALATFAARSKMPEFALRVSL